MNFTRILVLFLAIVSMTPAAKGQRGQKNAEGKSPALLKFPASTVTKAEFERVYAKNNGGPEAAGKHTPAQFREYLDLYINFKRKVFEAEALGLDTTAAFRNEFNSYRRQLAQPYLSARDVEEKLVREAYERSRYLINADHLLISAAPDASPADTLAAYQRALALRDSILKGGKDFGEMAVRYSGDPSAQSNRGNLGYFTAFNMVYPFETAAYSTAPGNVSMPVRTQFGYHLVKVNEKIESAGRKRAAHIIIRIGERYSARDSAQALEIIHELYRKLEDGNDFAVLASQFSDDPGSRDKGGDLGYERLLPEMEKLKIQLGQGQYSRPFRTQFGWHILKVSEVESQASFEESQSSLRQRVSRDSRGQLSRTALIQRLKAENQFRIDQAAFDAFTATLTPEFPRGNWKPDTAQQALYGRTLFSIGSDYSETLQQYIDHYLRTRPRKPALTPAQAAQDLLTAYTEQQLLKYEEDRLPAKNPDFRYLVQEYRDGILLFTLMEQKVWKKAVEDSTGLRNFYEANRASFYADESMDVREYRSGDQETAEQAAELLAAGKSEKQVDSLLNLNGFRLRISTQTYEKGKEGAPASLFSQPEGFRSALLAENGFYRILVIQKKYPAGIKPFEKAKSECITRYQEELEQNWLKELAVKYPVVVNEKVFAKLFK